MKRLKGLAGWWVYGEVWGTREDVLSGSGGAVVGADEAAGKKRGGVDGG